MEIYLGGIQAVSPHSNFSVSLGFRGFAALRPFFKSLRFYRNYLNSIPGAGLVQEVVFPEGEPITVVAESNGATSSVPDAYIFRDFLPQPDFLFNPRSPDPIMA